VGLVCLSVRSYGSFVQHVESFRGAVELDFSPIHEVDNEGIFLGGVKDNFVDCLILLNDRENTPVSSLFGREILI
jgi:hypothetical protein